MSNIERKFGPTKYIWERENDRVLVPLESLNKYFLEESYPSEVYIGLSGGGFRATAHHMGVLLAWMRYNQYDRLRVVNGVSGGAIAASSFGYWLKGFNPSDKESCGLKALRDFAEPLVAFMQTGVRGKALMGMARDFILRRGGSEDETLPPTSMQRLLDKHLFNDCSVQYLPRLPLVALTVTDWYSGRPVFLTSLGIAILPHTLVKKLDTYLPDQDYPLSQAVAASAAFPPVFRPLKFNLKGYDKRAYEAVIPVRKEISEEVYFLDGGVVDNRAISYIAEFLSESWNVEEEIKLSGIRHVLCMDAGLSSLPASEPGMFFGKRAALDLVFDRKEDIAFEATRSASKHYDISCEGIYRAVPELEDILGISGEILSKLGRVRTDLNRFSDTEIYALALSGYRLAILSFITNRWIGEDVIGTDEMIEDDFSRILQCLQPLEKSKWAAHLSGSPHRSFLKREYHRWRSKRQL